MSTILIAGGGTGGHVYPALATGREFQRRGHRVVFAGTKRGIEASVVPSSGFPLETIRVQGIRGRGLRGLWSMMRLPLSLLDAARILVKHSPRAVVGVGGYASGPVVALAALCGIKTLIEEQNVVSGATNRILGALVDAVALPVLPAGRECRRREFVAGLPIRKEFFRVKKNGRRRFGCWLSVEAKGPGS